MKDALDQELNPGDFVVYVSEDKRSGERKLAYGRVALGLQAPYALVDGERWGNRCLNLMRMRMNAGNLIRVPRVPASVRWLWETKVTPG